MKLMNKIIDNDFKNKITKEIYPPQMPRNKMSNLWFMINRQSKHMVLRKIEDYMWLEYYETN